MHEANLHQTRKTLDEIKLAYVLFNRELNLKLLLVDTLPLTVKVDVDTLESLSTPEHLVSLLRVLRVVQPPIRL